MMRPVFHSLNNGKSNDIRNKSHKAPLKLLYTIKNYENTLEVIFCSFQWKQVFNSHWILHFMIHIMCTIWDVMVKGHSDKCECINKTICKFVTENKMQVLSLDNCSILYYVKKNKVAGVFLCRSCDCTTGYSY